MGASDPGVSILLRLSYGHKSVFFPQLDFGPLPRSLEAKFDANLDLNFFKLRLDPLETLEGKVVFQPKDVAAYNFVLPCKVNAGKN